MGAGFWMQWVAGENVAAVDALLLHPNADAAAYMKTLAQAPIGPLARFLAAERNRSLYETWGAVQIVVSAIFFFFLLFGTRMGKVPLALALGLFLLVLAERLLLTPEIEMVGRATDFTADPSRRIHLMREAVGYGYTAAEVAKWVLSAAIAAFLIWQRGRSVDSRHEVDVVDKANYRHIDR